MYPVSLKISGFKSFAEPATLVFATGVSAVVGPNGCGKSNIIEALRWVMGEGSARRLRSAGDMEEVIFAGSGERPPFSRAEVTLTLENRKKSVDGLQENSANDPHSVITQNDTLTTDNKEARKETRKDTKKEDRQKKIGLLTRLRDEQSVAISRRIETGGGSTYRINGKEVLARDVQTLCADIGLGANATALVGQGQVAALVEAKPAERRSLIEEAAGVKGLYSRRSEANNMLENTQDTLARVEERLLDKAKRIKELTQENARAERYRVLSTQIKRWQASDLAREDMALQKSMEDLATRKQVLEAACEQGLVDLAKIEAQIVEAQQQQKIAENKELESAAHWQSLTQEIALLERSRKDTQEKKSALEQRRKAQIRTRDEQQKALAEVEYLWREAQEITKEITQEINVESKEKSTKGKAVKTATESAKNGQREQRLQDIDEEILAIDKKREGIRGRLRDLERQGAIYAERLEVSRKTKEYVEKELAKLSHELQQSDAKNFDASTFATSHDGKSQRPTQQKTRIDDNDLSRLAEEISMIEAAGEERQRKTLPQLRRTEEDALKQRESLDGKYRETYAELVAARNNQRDSLRLVSSSFAQAKDGEKKIVDKPLVVGLTIPKDLSLALFGALGEDLFATLQEGGMRYWLALKSADKETTLPLPQGVTSLAEHITAPRALRSRLRQIGLVDSKNQGDALQPSLKQGQRLVARDGSSWRWDGLHTDKAVAQGEQERFLSFLQWESLKQELASSEEALQQAEKIYTGSVADLTESLAQTRENYQRLLAEEKEAGEKLQALYKTLRAKENEAREQERQKARQDQLTLELDSTIETQRNTQAALQGLAERKDLDIQQDEVEKQRQVLLAERVRLLADKQREESSRARKQEEQRARMHNEQRLRRLKEQNAQILAHSIETLLDIEQQLTTLETRPALDLRKLDEYRQQHKRIEAERRKDKNALEQSNAQLARRKERRGARIARNEEEEKNLIRLQAQGEHLPTERARIEARSEEELQCPLTGLRERYNLDDQILSESPDLQKAARKSAIEKRARLGEINFAAKQTLQSLTEEQEEAQLQHKDVEEALAKLRLSVRKLEEEAAEKLLRVREEVADRFSVFIARLFGGGEAQLFFSDPEDPITSGLEIRLGLPGKKIRSLSAMSGGEQALVAIALILSVFSVAGGRFCILDEVDAALDDSNVFRFCNLLDDITQEGDTRFLIITHHRHTMSRAVRLYGVAMPEPGCSRIVTVALEDASERTRPAAE